jgi:signal transduction histidine kinase
MKDRRLIELRPWSDEIISLFKSELELALKQEKQGRFFPLTLRFPDLPGPIYFSVSFTPVITKKKEDNQLVLLVRDITERTMIEQRLNHTERMEAMGRLASGIAHDFRNTLNGVAGLATLLEKSADQSDRVSELARDIIETADSAQNSIQDLLNFAHPRMRSMMPCNLHEVVNSALGLARLISQIGVITEKQFLAEEAIVNGDASALQDAVLNIIINAKDAMPNGGKITLRTSNIDLSQEECDRSGFRLKPGRYIELVISDAGDGISEEHLSHIFEPFYTTKSAEKGTGLGLSSAYSTVLAHEGGIRVESRLQAGTSFVIHIPLLSTPRDEA